MDAATKQDTPIIVVANDKVALGPLRRDLLPMYARWINSIEVRQFLGVPLTPMTMEAEEEWFARVSRDTANAHFTIYEAQALLPIGTATLHGVDYRHLRATLGIMIGEPEYWSRGFGTEATRLILSYGFRTLGLHNIDLRVYSNNPRAIRCYQKAGFKEIGRRREAIRIGGELLDDVYMD